MNTVSEPSKSSWMDITNESVHTMDDKDIGDIEAISKDLIVVKQGLVNVHRYFIPISKVEGWDGHVVWLKITEEEVKKNYKRDYTPDPNDFYIQGYPYTKTDKYTSAYFPKMPIIPEKSQAATYTISPTSTYKTSSYKCVLCDAKFRSENDLSSHISTKH